ncbi:MAG: hypothetical protein J7493_05405 [Porphyrobacter sp.]|nr:hypothetical protein [Porphyrobacter sp.]
MAVAMEACAVSVIVGFLFGTSLINRNNLNSCCLSGWPASDSIHRSDEQDAEHQQDQRKPTEVSDWRAKHHTMWLIPMYPTSVTPLMTAAFVAKAARAVPLSVPNAVCGWPGSVPYRREERRQKEEDSSPCESHDDGLLRTDAMRPIGTCRQDEPPGQSYH